MEDHALEYEQLTQQLESYITLFSSQINLNTDHHVSRSTRSLSAHLTSSTLPRHVHRDTCSVPRHTSTLPRSHHFHNDSSLDTSDGDQQKQGFLSLPRYHQRRSRKYRSRSLFVLFKFYEVHWFVWFIILLPRSRTKSNASFNSIKRDVSYNGGFIEENNIDAINADNKRKSKFGDFLTRLKIFLLKRKDYDVQTLV